MSKDLIDLLLRLFTPVGTLVVVIVLGVFTAIYTAIIKYLFDRKLKVLESRQAIELAALQGRIAGTNQVVLQDLQTKSSAALKQLEAELTKATQDELQRAQAVLTEQHAVNQSRLDYEYEARKRLYHECEPLIFELLEFAENAADRIRGLARTARQHDLPRWLDGDSYYMDSTLYYLLAPVAVYKLMRRRLTAVDMTLDQNIARHYRLAKHLAGSFVDDFAFAWGLHVCDRDYDPNHSDWSNLRRDNEAKFWRQGLPYGRLDNAVESLIVRDHEPDGPLRIRGFGEFESALHKPGSVSDSFAIVRDIFTLFHPAKRPVLWRMLVAQAHIYVAIVSFHERKGGEVRLMVTPIPPAERAPFAWEKEPTAAQQQQMDDAFTVAEAYLAKYLGELWANA